jgi:hypothetical protein
MDAMRSDYIKDETTPFLLKCSNEGEYYKKVIPNFGFCERTEIFTGQTPVESGFFTAIGYDPTNSPFKNIKGLRLLEFIENIVPENLGIPGIIPPGSFYQLFRKLLNKWIIRQTNGVSSQNIPVSLLRYWDLTEDKYDHRDSNAFDVPSIFTLLCNKGRSYYYDSFTALNIPSNGSDSDRMKMMLNDLVNNANDFYLVYISTLDYYGHEYGPDSTETKEALSKVDEELEKCTKEVLKRDSDCNFIYLGDHGMASVIKYFNAENEILTIAKKHNIKLKKDFIYFLDSTLVRLWFFSEKGKSIFKNHIINSNEFYNNGIFIDEEIAEREKIPWKDKRYGDLIWWANTGVLVFPDFFHRVKKYKGMHGYDPNKRINQGTCIVYGKNIKNTKIESIYLTDVFNILKNTLSLNKKGI